MPTSTILVLVAAALSVATLAGCSDDGPSWEEQAGDAEWVVSAEPGPTATAIDLRVTIGSSSCNRLADVEVIETDEEVRLRAVVEYLDAGDDPSFVCTADLVIRPTTAQLVAPLGDRALTGCIDPGAEEPSAFQRPDGIGCEIPMEDWPR